MQYRSSPVPCRGVPPSGLSIDDLYRRPILFPIAQCVANLAVYTAMAAIAAYQPWQPFSYALWLPMGLVLVGFLAAAHDCVHGTFLGPRIRSGNRLVGVAWCAPLLVNYTAFKQAHLTHHRFTRVPGDSESHEQLHSIGEYLKQVVVGNPLRPLLTSVRIALRIFPAYIKSSEHQRAASLDSMVVVAWLLAIAALTAAHPRLLVAAYWGPLAFFGMMLTATALPEHYGCGVGPDALKSTRSVSCSALTRMLLWNGNFHAEHHLYPTVPSCHLPALSRRLAHVPILRAGSYMAFHLHLVRALCRRRTTRSTEPTA
jgi:fatty acid desaturase